MNTYLPRADFLDADSASKSTLDEFEPMRLDTSKASWIDFTSVEVDANEELAAVHCSLESMRFDPSLPGITTHALITLNGALLLFQLGGRQDLLPSVSTFAFGRRFTERRLVSAARRLAFSNDPYTNWLAAGEAVDSMIGLVDPELGASVRAVA